MLEIVSHTEMFTCMSNVVKESPAVFDCRCCVRLFLTLFVICYVVRAKPNCLINQLCATVVSQILILRGIVKGQEEPELSIVFRV